MTAPIRDVFAERLNHLMDTVPHPDGGKWTNGRLSKALSLLGVSASDGYLSQLRSKVRRNPSAAHVGGIAQALGVPVGYFFDEDTTELDRLVNAAVILRDHGAREVAELSLGMPPAGVAAMKQLAVLIRQLSGLPIPEGPDQPGLSTEPPGQDRDISRGGE